MARATLFPSDIYVCCMGQSNMVTPKDWYVALVSTTVETNNPENEIKPGLALLEPIYQKFVSVSDLYEPVDDGEKSRVSVIGRDGCQMHTSIVSFSYSSPARMTRPRISNRPAWIFSMSTGVTWASHSISQRLHVASTPMRTKKGHNRQPSDNSLFYSQYCPRVRFSFLLINVVLQYEYLF